MKALSITKEGRNVPGAAITPSMKKILSRVEKCYKPHTHTTKFIKGVEEWNNLGSLMPLSKANLVTNNNPWDIK